MIFSVFHYFFLCFSFWVYFIVWVYFFPPARMPITPSMTGRITVGQMVKMQVQQRLKQIKQHEQQTVNVFFFQNIFLFGWEWRKKMRGKKQHNERARQIKPQQRVQSVQRHEPWIAHPMQESLPNFLAFSLVLFLCKRKLPINRMATMIDNTQKITPRNGRTIPKRYMTVAITQITMVTKRMIFALFANLSASPCCMNCVVCISGSYWPSFMKFCLNFWSVFCDYFVKIDFGRNY